MPASSKDTSTGANNGFIAEEEALDIRYLEGDNSDVDPAIQEKLAVYIARYSYDPYQHSPNENPDMELAFQAGDYLYVFGEMDEVRKYKLLDLSACSSEGWKVPSHVAKKKKKRR